MSQLDSQSKITLEDGTEVSVADLIASHKDLKDALAINENLQKDFEEVGYLFRSDMPMERRQEAIRSVLSNLGYDDSQIQQYVQATQASSAEPEAVDDEVAEVDSPDLEEDSEENSEDPYFSGGSREDIMSEERANLLQKELETQRAELHRMRVRELRDNLNTNLDRVLKSNPDFQKLIESTRATRGEEGVGQAMQTLRSQLEQRALERMQSRRAAAGTFEDAWMSEEVDKAAEPVLGTFRSVIGDIDRLGRSSETVTGFDAQEILRSKPVPEPEWKSGATISDLESQIKSFTSDSLRRAMASSSGESSI